MDDAEDGVGVVVPIDGCCCCCGGRGGGLEAAAAAAAAAAPLVVGDTNNEFIRGSIKAEGDA